MTRRVALYRCKCGKLEITSSMPPHLCTSCATCHKAPRFAGGKIQKAKNALPHRMLIDRVVHCSYCGKTTEQIPPGDLKIFTAITNGKKRLQSMAETSGQGDK